MRFEDTLGAGLVVVGIALFKSNELVGMLFVGFGLGYCSYPHISKMFGNKT